MGGSAIDDDWEPINGNGSRTVVLVGRTGNGKSATGNSIIGRKVFKSRASSYGVTTTSELQTTLLTNAQFIHVIDTPGLFDFSAGSDFVGKEIVKCIDLAKDGIHAILLVLSVRTRFSLEEESALRSLQVLFGNQILDYMILVFTGGDELEDNDETLEDYLGRECPKPLKDVLALCKNRCVLFDNKTKDELKRINQVHQLLSLVSGVLTQNGGQPFTDELFTDLKEGAKKLRDQQQVVDSLKDYSKQEISELKEQMHRSYEEQLKRITEMVLFLEALHLFSDNSDLPLSNSSLFGFSPSLASTGFYLADAVCIIISTLISVAFHEFGHAVSAASEGVKLEYVALFIALLFPGALVAFNHNSLQDSSCFTALRIYCAGIWHNAVLSGACRLILSFLPLILFPLYSHGNSPTVLDVPSTSPLFGYLSHGDIIVSLDGMQVRSVEDWNYLSSQINDLTFQNGTLSKLGDNNGMASGGKGYCVPNFMMNESNEVQFTHDQSTCSGDFASFTTIPCVSTATLIDGDVDDGHPDYGEGRHCFNVSDVTKLKKCTNGWDEAIINGSTCTCSQGETCLGPVQVPGLVWVEITYLNPHSLECLYSGVLPSSNCSATFIFVGDVISMARSIQLTTYQPRWDFHFAAYLPNVMERILLCLFHVSLALALLNILPVYYLDGESIMESIVFHFTSMSPSYKGKVLQSLLMGGTLISILFLLRFFFHLFVS